MLLYRGSEYYYRSEAASDKLWVRRSLRSFSRCTATKVPEGKQQQQQQLILLTDHRSPFPLRSRGKVRSLMNDIISFYCSIVYRFIWILIYLNTDSLYFQDHIFNYDYSLTVFSPTSHWGRRGGVAWNLYELYTRVHVALLNLMSLPSLSNKYRMRQ